MRRVSCVVLALSVSILYPGVAAGQDALAGLVKRVLDQATINRTTPSRTAPAGYVCQPLEQSTNCVIHQPHFLVGESLRLTTREVNVAIAEQLSSFPLSSSSGGFSFRVDKDGAVVPASTTFGPAFAERGLTIGEGKFNFGFSFQATSYDSFEGIDLESGGLTFIREHNDCCPTRDKGIAEETNFDPAFERDLLQSSLRLTVDSRTTAFFANYGVTNRLDVGIAIPISHVEMDATVDGNILRLGSGSSTFHQFENGGAEELFAESGSATGLGDILVRSKYNFYRTETTALAAAIDLRLPTGDKDNLLGTGATQANVFFVGSGEYGVFSPHLNLGYTFSNGETSEESTSFESDPAFGTVPPEATARTVDLSIPNEFNYVAGVAVAVHPRVTVGFDFRGRNIRDVPRFGLENKTYPHRGTGASIPSTSFESSNEVGLESRDGNLNLLLGVLGAKFNIGSTFLLNVSVLFSMTDNGLKPKPTPVIGFDYVF